MFTAVVFTVTVAATLAAWMLIASAFSLFAGVGTVEVLLLLIPALVVGGFARRRTRDLLSRGHQPP
jgi:hypothetical protein